MDLSTTYLGLPLKNPLIVSASPLSEKLDNFKRMEDAGAAAVVMFSLFEEQIKHEDAAMDYLCDFGTNSFAESLSFFPEPVDYRVGPDAYLDLLRSASEAVDIPVIGSLNGVSNDGWTRYARDMEQAGASAIELNLYHLPVESDLSSEQVESRYFAAVRSVKAAVSIPVAVKLSPFISSFGYFAKQLDAVGADGLVLFNRFFQPDIDLETREVMPSLQLSQPYEVRLPLLWIATLYGQLDASMAATRGVQSSAEVLKYIMAGADGVMTASALLRNGIEYLRTMLNHLEEWMDAEEYESIEQMKGSMSRQALADSDATAYDRANYIKTLTSYENKYA